VSKFRSIINGWANYIFEKPEIELMAMERAKACSKCEHASHAAILDFFEDEVKEIKGMVCDFCDCPLSTKLRSIEEKCPLGLWQ